MLDQIHQLLREIGPGTMSSTAYDTAWVARLGEFDRDLSNQALEWLCEHQLSDGSWGAEEPYYYHDRVISTLAALIALNDRGRRARDKQQIERGLKALEQITAGATKGLMADPNGATVGFEMIVPTLVSDAEKLGIIKNSGQNILGRLAKQRQIKLSLLKGKHIDRRLTAAFSSEMAGSDGQHMLDKNNLQESNGSVGLSPSASAYFALYIKKGNPDAIKYIYQATNENWGMPNVSPIDVFEPAWVLWNLQLIPDLDKEILTLFKPHLDFLQRQWVSGVGIGHGSKYTPKDSDDTALVFDLLTALGRHIDVQAILNYEEKTHFRCFSLEADPSISANIHVLGALHRANFDKDHPSVKKIITYLSQNRQGGKFWFDKWHASPYYATSHAIISGLEYDYDLCANAIQWIIETQRSDGSWGYYSTSTAEETAYCLQALAIWHQNFSNVPKQVIKRGAFWLEQNYERPYQPLWIGKALYCPQRVVRSTVISALVLASGE